MRRKFILWLALLAASVVLGSLFLAIGREKSSANSGLNKLSAQQLPTVQGPLENVRFTIYDAGIYPREMRVRHGRVVIHLVDYTGSASGLAVERDAVGLRTRVGQVTRRNAHWRWQQELNLIPGTYYVSDLVRTQNQATLVVEP